MLQRVYLFSELKSFSKKCFLKILCFRLEKRSNVETGKMGRRKEKYFSIIHYYLITF